MNDGREKTLTVTLDADEVTQEMAARLTIALLSQILYMKGQVPVPVASLNRFMDREATENTSRTATRAKKRRLEFLESYDDLTSHLRTTFVALSTALAKNENEHPICSASTSTTTTEQNSCPKKHRHPAKVHILLILGPSPSTAKARYLLEFDRFRVEQFGEWQYIDHAEQEQCSSESEDELPGSSSFISPTSPVPPVTPPRSPSLNLDNSASPCSSLSEVASSSLSVPSSPSAVSASDNGESSDGSAGLPEELDSFILEQRTEEASLRSGERLLYRALFAGHEGLGFGDEISPTKVHVFIHAPRRFTHPTWVPRQNLGSTLDRHVQHFLESESCLTDKQRSRARNDNNAGFGGVGLRTVGVRVTCKGENECAEERKLLGTIDSCDDGFKGDEDEKEEDELIWWSWDGKLVGFSD